MTTNIFAESASGGNGNQRGRTGLAEGDAWFGAQLLEQHRRGHCQLKPPSKGTGLNRLVVMM
ncbi:MAG: hypothetical protein WCO83_14120 [Alphaproteobacteria bacterium]